MNIVYGGLLLIMLQAHKAHGFPWINEATLKFVGRYLQKYGYLHEIKQAEVPAVLFAIRQFKKDIGLKQPNELDIQTLRMMMRPRCGNPGKLKRSRFKRFVPHKMRWFKKSLTWKLDDPFDLLGKHERYVVRTTLHRAFGEWSIAAQKALRFREQEDEDTQVSFRIYFARGDHNDSLPFDGEAGIVAHGFYPTKGDLHFDADEQWTLHTENGINLYQTAMHEIGHLLGLEHSNDHESVMFPINRPYDPHFKLGDDDIRGIRYLYAPWAWTGCTVKQLENKRFQNSLIPDINRYLEKAWNHKLTRK